VKASQQTFKVTFCQITDTFEPFYIINPEIVFKRALALANVREEVTVEKVLACPIGQIPTALFHDDELMRKSCKSDLINLLEKRSLLGVHTS
jgi:hypothetical protein